MDYYVQLNKDLKYFLLACFSVLSLFSFSQNETKKWYFGNQAGLDFMTTPPTILTNGALNTWEGCSSIADASGNLLFYTDGVTVWNQLHMVMANGTGLLGHYSSTQSGLIVKQPGNSNIYFVFTVDVENGANGLRYSIVDMNLAAGMGSVTTKNVLIFSPSTEKVAAVRHCNGIDIWVVSHDANSNNFRSNLITSLGINLSSIVSSVGTSHSFSGNSWGTLAGHLKFSSNGRKLGVAISTMSYNPSSSTCEIFDFDNTTGAITNFLSLCSINQIYGCEFSPDGTKFYGCGTNGDLYQWDLCAGSNAAIIASQFTVFPQSWVPKGSLQLGPDGKIYVARVAEQSLGVINNPNTAGIACNYVDIGQSISPKTGYWGLPNFVPVFSQPLPPPFTHTVYCQAVVFTPPSLLTCGTSGYSLTNLSWNFGDPASGYANTSTVANPVHHYTSPGTYTTTLILYYSCGGGTDTLKQVVNSNQPCISVNNSSITCASLGSATVAATAGIGPFSYTWMPSGQVGPVATNLGPGTYTIVIHDAATNLTYTTTTVFTSAVPFTGILNNTASLTCNGAANGTANITNITGGSSNQTYLWFNGVSSYTTSSVTNLSAGSWSVTVTDVLTGCLMTHTFYISQPPPLTLTVTPGTGVVCPGDKIKLIASGTGSSYTWSPVTGLSSAYGATVSANPAGPQIYTVTTSLNSCTDTAVTTVTFSVSQTPTASIVISKPGICLNELITLQGFGGQSYYWTGPANLMYAGQTVTFVANHVAYSGTYTLTVANANGCKSTASVVIVVNDLPEGNLSGTKMQGCVPFCEDFKFSSSGNVSSLITTWEINKQVFTAKNFSYCFNNPGNYIITGTLKDTLSDCQNTKTLSINAYPVPVAEFVYSPERPIEGLETVIFTNNSKGEDQTNWNWFFINNDGYRSFNENTSYFFGDAGVYPVAFIVKNTWGCSDSMVKIIKVELDFNVYVPNVFSPNADGRNDIFLPTLRGIKFYKLTIFNRWGEKIFETDDVLMGWDGTLNGKDCKNDAYTWKIYVSALNGDMKQLTGHVTLNR